MGGPAGTDAPEGTRAAELYVAPQVDIYEDEHGLVVVADLPGVPPKALEVPVEAGVLTIQGRAAHEPPGHPLHEEYKLEGFFREFRLSEAVDAEAIVAESRHGVLTLHPPQKAETTRKIEVRTSESWAPPPYEFGCEHEGSWRPACPWVPLGE